MTMPDKWLLLLYGLPGKSGGARVSLWRQLKKSGALPFKTAASLLPDTPEHDERFQWLAQQVREAGGEATLLRVSEIEGLRAEDLVRQFNEARAADYEALRPALSRIAGKKKPTAAERAEIERCAQQFEEIRRVDFFGCPRAQDVEMLLTRVADRDGNPGKAGAILQTRKYAGRTWLTRPRPHIDRVGSAWLIRRFIDPRAKFVFATDPARHPEALPFDLTGVEFSHHGEDCTFETLVRRFGVTDAAVRRIAEIVHDVDLGDDKFGRTEGRGLDLVLRGWAKENVSDQEILDRGGECFEALYLALA
ncbi:MAG: chromate resistance protein [Verrucomicrobia bacterium]|nr:chromate resistance protein [Verrucomicrobiota bacterium]